MDRGSRSESEDSRRISKKQREKHSEKQLHKQHKKKRKHSRSRSQSLSDSNSSNFKFQSKRAHKMNHKKKKKYKRDRKSSRSSRSSRSSKSNDQKQQVKYDRHRQCSRSREKNQQKQKSSELARPRLKINGGFLSGLILDQKFNNKKLDEQEIANTGQKLQKNFNLDRKPVAMSQYLSNESLRVNISKIQNKIYTCELQKCQKRFHQIQQFQKHIQDHKQGLTR